MSVTTTVLRSGQSGTESVRPPRVTLWWARIVCLSVFGPYVTGSARTEQIVVFASFAAILIVGWPQIAGACSIPVMPFLVAWLALDAIILIGTVSRPYDPSFYGPQPASHAIAAYMLPIALMVLTWFWTLSADGPELIRAIAPIVIGAMVVNTAISLSQLVTGNVAVLSFLPRFWDTPGSLGSVAANAAGNSRFTGIFNQPAEAGVAYGAALFSLIYLAQRREIRAGMTILCAVALIVGGVLTISKVFLLGALPLALVMTLRSPRGRIGAIAYCAAAAAAFWLLETAHLLPSWEPGAAALGGLLHPSGSLTAEYTAGRYGTGGSLGPVVSDVLHASPWYGFGAGGLTTPYDSLWVQVFVVAGIAGVILAAAVLLMLAFGLWRQRGVIGPAEWNLAGAMLVLAIGATLGLPSLTANRDATLLWLVLGILIAAKPRVSERLRGGDQSASHDPRGHPHAPSVRAITLCEQSD
jgi:hypothetical protein